MAISHFWQEAQEMDMDYTQSLAGSHVIEPQAVHVQFPIELQSLNAHDIRELLFASLTLFLNFYFPVKLHLKEVSGVCF